MAQNNDGVPELTPGFAQEVLGILTSMNVASQDAESIVTLVRLARQMAAYNTEMKTGKIEISIRETLCLNLQSFIFSQSINRGELK